MSRRIINIEFHPTGIVEILDKQCSLPYYQDQGVYELLRADPNSVTRIMSIRMYFLGYIAGKRAERARRKKQNK